MIVQRASQRAGVPWRNGLGVQYEIAAETGWRLSTADLTTDVQFSVFAGFTRGFCIAQGAGVNLTIDGSQHRCEAASVTVFDGGADVYCTLIEGSAKALNLMVPNGEPKRHLEVFRPGQLIAGDISVAAIVAIGGPMILCDNSGRSLALGLLDAVLEPEASLTVAEGLAAAVLGGGMVVIRP